jgi:hypothetical protein
MAMVLWLSVRLGRKPSMRPGQVGLVLALNGVLPVALITTAVALLSPQLAATPWMPVALGVAWMAALGIALVLLVSGIVAGRSEQAGGQRAGGRAEGQGSDGG